MDESASGDAGSLDMWGAGRKRSGTQPSVDVCECVYVCMRLCVGIHVYVHTHKLVKTCDIQRFCVVWWLLDCIVA
jgi:hypothetical protein